jgi:hypothetical protein
MREKVLTEKFQKESIATETFDAFNTLRKEASQSIGKNNTF